MAKNFSKPPQKTKAALFEPPKKTKEEVHFDFVKFSFKYLIRNDESFNIEKRPSEYFLKLIERLSHVCTMTCAELKYPKQKALRNHGIDWDDTSRDGFGLPNEEQLVDKPFQFGISANEHGRVIGFFIGQVFYIVWFDPDHKVYS